MRFDPRRENGLLVGQTRERRNTLPDTFQFEVEEARRVASEETSPIKKDAPEITRVPKSSTSEKVRESKLSGFVNGNTKTTQIGYVNRNQQRCCGQRGSRGSDHGQVSYKMECLNCTHAYGANGTDVFQRKCPKCQSGAPGIPF